MNPFIPLILHTAFFLVVARLYSPFSFFLFFHTIVSCRLLHLFLTSVHCHLFLAIASTFTDSLLGPLTASEFPIYKEKVINVLGDLLILSNLFSYEISIRSLTTLTLLYAIQSYSWIMNIKAQRIATLRIVLGSVLVQALAMMLISTSTGYSTVLSKLSILECSLAIASIMRSQLVMILNISEEENNRTLYMFVINIVYLVAKIFVFCMFSAQLAVKGRFPFGILKSMIQTATKLGKKMKLLHKYVRLLVDLESIEETEQDQTCAICTEEIERGKKLQCTHVFHSSCLKMWCEREVSCPICRAELVFRREVVHETRDELLTGIPVEIEEAVDGS